MNTTIAKGASAPVVRFNEVSDHLSEAAHLVEAAWMAAADLSQPAEREAIRSVLHYVAILVTGARDDVDAYRAATRKAVAA
jgi:hypothetical protein